MARSPVSPAFATLNLVPASAALLHRLSLFRLDQAILKRWRSSVLFLAIAGFRRTIHHTLEARLLLPAALLLDFCSSHHLTGVVSSLTSASPTSSSSITFLMPHVVLRRDWNNLRIAITTNPWVFHVSHVPTGLSGRLLIQPQVEQAPSTYPRGTFFFVSVCLQGYRASVYFYRRT